MRVGITGSIATGKSEVTSIIKSLGYVVIDTDKISYEIANDPKIIDEISKIFGLESVICFENTKKLNRLNIRKQISENKVLLSKLNNIFHPRVYEKMLMEEKKHSNQKIIFFDIPLLYETKYEKNLDKVILVYANQDIQLNRLMLRDTINEKIAKKFINMQMPINQKLERADYIIENNSSLQALQEHTIKIIEKLKLQFLEENMSINKYIDHTALKAVTTIRDIETLCKEAKENNFASVCIPPSYVKLSSEILKNSDVKVCTVIGFPLGNTDTETKIFETKKAISNGASEIDMVINIGFLKSKKFTEIFEEIKGIKKACGENILKVIVETCYLEKSEIEEITTIVSNAGADFIKTSTGFGTRGASFEDIKIFKSMSKKLKIKAAGGIRDKETAEKYIEMGVDRLGTSSGIKILAGEKLGEKDY